MLRRLFRDHPATLGESYGEHAAAAGGFGLRMIGGGIACLVHAAVPGWFATRGSDTVRALHADLVAKRAAARAAGEEAASGWVI